MADRYQCGLCGAEFDNKGTLTGHMAESHPASQAANDFECTTCGARFGSANELVEHVKYSHTVPIVVNK